jgi:predicted O-methyltransferase YrrM
MFESIGHKVLVVLAAFVGLVIAGGLVALANYLHHGSVLRQEPKPKDREDT